MEAFVTGDEFVGEGQAGHEAAFLEPEDRGEGAAEKDAFDGGEGDEALGEGGGLVLDPFDGPVGFLADAGNWNPLALWSLVVYLRGEGRGWGAPSLVSMASKR